MTTQLASEVTGLTKDEWKIVNPRRLHPRGFPLVRDYPSQVVPPHLPPAPMLLDTCVIQHISWIRPQRETTTAEINSAGRLASRFGENLARDLIGLAALLPDFDYVDPDGDEPPWIVSPTSLHELSQTTCSRTLRAREEWRRWDERARLAPDWVLSTIERTRLQHTDDDAPDPRQPSLFPADPTPSAVHPFKDSGDVRLIRDAVRLGAQAILTTDLRSFWTHRQRLYENGIEVWRPIDVLESLLNYGLLGAGPVCVADFEGLEEVTASAQDLPNRFRPVAN